MKSIIKFILLNSVKDKLYLGTFIALAIIFSVSIFVGNTALAEQQHTSLVFIAGASRAAIIFGMTLFVCLTIHSSFENKEIEFIISKPISREKFIISYLVGFFLAAFFIISTSALTILLIGTMSKAGLLLWFLSLIFESLIVISFALLSSLILKNSLISIMATIGFYGISRLMGFFLLAINMPKDLSQIKNGFFESLLKLVSFAFPRLDLFAQSSWIIYGVEDLYKIKVIFLQSLIYIPLMIFMALHDFRKKEF